MKKFLILMAIVLPFFAQAAGDTKASIELLKKNLNALGAPKIDGKEKAADKEVPALYFGSRKINNNYIQVDDVKKKQGGTATVFVKSGDEYIRITTNVLKDDGTRAVGTLLAKNKAFDAIQKGETFCGEVEILGSPYDTCYEPIKGSDGKTIGIYYVGFKK